MRLVFLKDQSSGSVESGLEDMETKGEKGAITVPLGMEGKR